MKSEEVIDCFAVFLEYECYDFMDMTRYVILYAREILRSHETESFKVSVFCCQKGG